MKKSLFDFSSAKIEEGLNYEMAGRICRLLKLFSESKQYLEKGISISSEFPVYQAALYFELAKTLYAMGDSGVSAALKSIDLYNFCECPRQIETIKSFLDSIS